MTNTDIDKGPVDRLRSVVATLAGFLLGVLVATKQLLYGDDPDPGAIALMSAGYTTLLATLAMFVWVQSLVAFGVGTLTGIAVVGWITYQASTARMLALVATVSTVLTIALITVYLFTSAWPAIERHGIDILSVPAGRWFFWLEHVLPTADSYWNPSAGAVSLLPWIWGTVIVTLIAAAVAGPLGLLGALFISEVAGDRLRAVIKPGVEILAGIPSIVYGFIGFAILNNFVREAFFDQVGGSFLIAGLVVGIMALPTVVSVSEDTLSSVPSAMADGSIAMGATKWQTMKSISVPAAFSGISAAIILGIGRAIGETMAVAAIMAGGTNFADPLYDLFDQHVTLTSLIATQYGSASEGLFDVLFLAGVMLFLIVAGTSVLSQYIERRMERKLRGER